MMDYSLLKEQMDALTGTQSRPIPNLANASALIWQMLGDINWAGFYLMERDTLYLGPFQGKPACIRIPLGQGCAETQRRKIRYSEYMTYTNLKGTSHVTVPPGQKLCFRFTAMEVSLLFWISTVL